MRKIRKVNFMMLHGWPVGNCTETKVLGPNCSGRYHWVVPLDKTLKLLSRCFSSLRCINVYQ